MQQTLENQIIRLQQLEAADFIILCLHSWNHLSVHRNNLREFLYQASPGLVNEVSRFWWAGV